MPKLFPFVNRLQKGKPRVASWCCAADICLNGTVLYCSRCEVIIYDISKSNRIQLDRTDNKLIVKIKPDAKTTSTIRKTESDSERNTEELFPTDFKKLLIDISSL